MTLGLDTRDMFLITNPLSLILKTPQPLIQYSNYVGLYHNENIRWRVSKQDLNLSISLGVPAALWLLTPSSSTDIVNLGAVFSA